METNEWQEKTRVLFYFQGYNIDTRHEYKYVFNFSTCICSTWKCLARGKCSVNGGQ